jgi:hypothetical protein
MASNTNIQIAELDFTNIKSNFINYLKSQDTFKDYNFSGSALSVLLDVLAYNTQYNAYYLNMVANEMFLDSAVQRSSVVSHAKLLNYTPQSAIAPTATINLALSGVTSASYTLPKFTNFMSEPIKGVNYNFVTTNTTTVNTINNVASFNNLEIKQGIPATYTYSVNSVINPTYTFQIPDANVDTSSVQVTVQQSSSNTNFVVYTEAQNYLSLTSSSPVYFLQEATNGYYEIYFGDGALGNKLSDGNIVAISYIVTDGTSAYNANNFSLMTSLPGYSTYSIFPVTAASSGKNKETIDSIKFQAPKSYAAQGRAVTKDDYITALQKNTEGLSFDAVNVWGGEENNPPVYGIIYIAAKPSGGYALTEAQKQIITNNIINPISILTVTPKIIDIDYVYLLLSANILYDSKKSTYSSSQISQLVTQGTINFCNKYLNDFNSTFIISDLILYIKSLDYSIVSVDFDLYLQKRFIPNLNSSQNYTINFGNPIELATGNKQLSITPSFATYDTKGNYYDNVYLEPAPDSTTNLDTITLVSGGSGYTAPQVFISGDGNGATATATVVQGVITGITVITGGSGFTQVTVIISDPTGSGAIAQGTLRGNYGNLRSYYFSNGVKNILNSNAGYVDYDTGEITLTNFNPTLVNNTDGIMRFNAFAKKRIVSSSYDKLITLDSKDSSSVSVNLTTIN